MGNRNLDFKFLKFEYLESRFANDIYPLELIKSALRQLDRREGSLRYDVLRPILPYLIQKSYKYEKMWIPLNRDYKPLGLGKDHHVDYDTFSFLLIPEDRLDLGPLKNYAYNNTFTEMIFFYHDVDAPCTKKHIYNYIKRVLETIKFNKTEEK